MIQPSHPAKRSFIASIFISPAEPRLRAGWRLLLQTILLVVLLIFPGTLLYLFFIYVLPFGNPSEIFAAQVAEALAVSLSVLLCRRFLDRRTITSLGLKPSWKALQDILVGFALSGIMISAIYLLEWQLGWLEIRNTAWQVEPPHTIVANLVVILLIFILVGWNEELLSRGYLLQNIRDGLNPLWGMILSSVVFGALHLMNANSSFMAVAGIFLAGMLFAFGYLLTRQLWLPIGLHIGWNFFEGVIFGFPVSGSEFFSLIRLAIHGPQIWTGGAFGPEAGLIVIPALALGAALIYLYSHLRTDKTL